MSLGPLSIEAPSEGTSIQRTYRWAVIGAILITTGIRTSLIARSFFWQDDYVHAWKAWNLTPGELIFQIWNGHFEVGSMSVLWLTARLWPQEWLPAALYLTALSILLPVLFWLAISRLCGPTKPAVLALILFCVWPGLALPETWFSAGLELTWLAFGLATIYVFAAGWRRAGAWGSVFVILGYGFSERVVFTLPLVFTAMVLVADGGVVSRVRHVWASRRQAWLLLLSTTAVVAVIAAVMGRQDPQTHAQLTVAQWAAGYRHAVVDGVLRGVGGWPVTWGDGRGTFPEAPAVWQSAVIVLCAITLLVIAFRANRQQALVISAVLAPWLLLEPTLVMTSRSMFLTMVGPVMMMDARYLVPGSVALLLCIAAWRGNSRTPTEGVAVRLGATLAVVGALMGLAGIGPMVDASASRVWLANAKRAFVGPDVPPSVSNGSPGFMLGTLFFGFDAEGDEFEFGTTRTLLDVGEQRPRFNVPTVFPLGAGDDGRPAIVDAFPVKSSTPEGFGADCSVVVDHEWTTVPMSHAGLGNPILGVDLLPDAPVVVEVRAANWSQSLSVSPGLKTAWFFPDPGPFADFEIRVVSGDSTVCVGRARAGQPFVERS